MKRLADRLAPGLPYPLGAQVCEDGVNFALFSDSAQDVDLCLFDASGSAEVRRYRLPCRTDGVFHGRLPGVGAGLVYGYRVHGPYRPEDGLRFNANKLVLDPYAREIVGHFTWSEIQHGYWIGDPGGDRSFDGRDNARIALKSRVAAALAPRDAPPAPVVAPGDAVLYELHVKSQTKRLDAVPAPLRGTYAGLGHPASIAHLRRLGVTTVSLLPVHQWIDEAHLAEKNLRNHWGYNTIGFFCPEPRLSSTPADPAATRAEFRAMVDALHAGGLQVILDVVYNHTAEGDGMGPTLSWRGIDNLAYYRLARDDRSRYENLTGCGNTVNVAHPRVLQMVMDSLRLWAGEMGVDGFRFDLATVLARNGGGFDSRAPFFSTVAQDPLLQKAVMIAEPWDVGPGGYQLGRFPRGWLEWNDRYRDSVRRYFLHRGVARGELARRFTASSDVFNHGRRGPCGSVNFIAAHDGFTLADLVSYRQRHNEANGENNRDGRDGEPADHCGVEGPTTDATVLALRSRLVRALLATTLLSQGTPMLRGGDELGQSQRGNNNAYCQDNPLAWIDWSATDDGLIGFVAQLLQLRRAEPALRNAEWFVGAPDAHGERDLVWLRPDGAEMQHEDWVSHDRFAFGCRKTAPAPRGRPAARPLLVLFNPETAPVTFHLPSTPSHWVLRLDSAHGAMPATTAPIQGAIVVTDRAVAVLSAAEPPEGAA